MAYSRLETQDGVTKMTKALYDNLQDGIDEAKNDIETLKEQGVSTDVLNEAINTALENNGVLKIEVLTALPETGEDNTLYVVKNGDTYYSYLWIDLAFVPFNSGGNSESGGSNTLVVNTLPATGDSSVDYIVKTDNGYMYYKWINSKWEAITGTINGSIAQTLDTLPNTGSNLIDYYIKTESGYVHYRWINDTWELINKVDSALESSSTFVNLTNQVSTNTNSINSLTSEVENLKNTSGGSGSGGNVYDVSYKSNIFTLYENDEIKTQFTITGGSGESTGGIAIHYKSPSSGDMTVLYGNDANISYEFISIDSAGDSTGKGTASWTINNKLVMTQTITQGVNIFNVKDYLVAGTNNIVKLTVVDSMNRSTIKTWTVNAINMYITSTFDDTQIYEGDAILNYTPYGDIEKTVHIKLNGEDTHTETVTTSGRQQFYTIPHQSHGTYSVEVYCTATLDTGTVVSNSVLFDVMFLDVGDTTPLIRCAYDGSNLTQYSAKVFEYSVYTPGSLTSKEVTISINDSVVATLKDVGREVQQWSYKPMDYGTKTIVITCGVTTKVLNIVINKFPYDISQQTTGLAFDFNPSGRTNNDSNYDSYTYGDYSMTVSENFDWNNGGWKIDEDGNSYFCVKAGTTMQVDYPLFGDDAKKNGKDFKFIYKAVACHDFNAQVMSCLLNNVGVQVNAQNAVLCAGGTTIDVPYCEDTYMELEFNIQPDSSYSEILAVLDGDYSKVAVYSSTDTFNQSTTNTDKKIAPVVFGSPDCDVLIYRFKAYTKCLDDDEIMDNRIADAPNAEEMIARYTRNQILNSEGEVDYNKLAQVCPDLRIILITCPRFTKGKKDEITGCTVQQIYTNGGTQHCWTANNVKLKGQGTSSDNYGDSSRNIDINCTEGFIFTDNTTSDTYSMTPNSIGESYFNIKVNVASSENANNSRFANDYHTYQPYLRQARIDNPKVRDTMEFHPCVVFIQETNTTESVEFHDGKMHFYSCGDFGNSKKNNTALGMDLSNPLECIVEIDNNTSPHCRFKSDDFSAETWDGDNAVEFRYPNIKKLSEDVVTTLKANVQRLWSWVVSTDPLQATNRALTDEELACVADWGATFTTDSADYRKAKFINQFDDYFISDSVMYHYLFTERHCMVDNRAKNTFIHTSDGLHWDYVFDYDNDTADGNDNEGGLTLEYGYEDTDTIGSKNVYNAADSVLWCNVRDLLFDRLTKMFIDRESAGAWNSTRILSDFNTYQWVKPERLEIIDMRRKYLRPYEDNNITSYLPMMYGRKTHQRKRFEIYQEKYISSKYVGSSCKSDVITLRCYTPTNYVPTESGGVTPCGKLVVTPYTKMYINILVGSRPFKIRANRGEAYTVDFSDITLNDTETYIYSASLIQEIGDLAPLYVGYCNFNFATKLQVITIGSSNSQYENTNLKEVSFGNNELLAYLDVRNCPNMKDPLDLSGCIGLKEIYTTGTNISGLSFASGGLLEKAILNAVSSISLKNLNYLSELELPFDNLYSVVLENCPTLDSHAFIELCTSLTRLRLIGIDWKLQLRAILDFLYTLSGIDENGHDLDNSVVSGKVYIPAIGSYRLQQFNEMWNNLEITYDTLIPCYAVTFVNYDGTVLYTDYVETGKSAIDPIEEGYITAPTRESSVQYDYTYSSWDNDLTNVTADRIVTAQYSESIRSYHVQWIGQTGAILDDQTAEYGSTVTYSGETPVYVTDEDIAYVEYRFNGWNTQEDGSGTSYTATDEVTVSGNVILYAQFVRIPLVDYKFPDETLATKLSANGDYGIYAYANSRNGESQDDWHTLDGSTKTAWMVSTGANTQEYGQIIVVFPFPVKVQSVTITNKSTLYASTASTVNGLETGYIYLSSDEHTVDEWDTIAQDLTKTIGDYMLDASLAIDRTQPSTTEELKGYSTTHDMSDFADKWVRAIGIRGTAWGPNKNSSWRVIGEISIAFKANPDDIETAGLPLA